MSPDGRSNSPAPGTGLVLAGQPDEREEGSLNIAQLRHFLHAPFRHPLLVLVPWAGILLMAILALFALPKRYKSSTLILVESQKVPDSFVPRVATEDRSQRLEAIRPEILSRTRLEKVLAETHPYPSVDSITRAVERMRQAIFINITGNDGFTLEFVHSDPKKAQQVADRIATLFIEETINAREQQVEGAVDFLVTQVADARKELEKKDEALRRYKEGRMGSLPEQLQTNLTTMGMLQQELQTVEESLIFARAKRDSLARRGVRAVPAPPVGAVPTGFEELEELRRQLAALKGRYTDEHPDVQRLNTRIARLEGRMSAISGNDSQVADDLALAREQLETANLEVKKLDDRRSDLERRMTIIRARVEETPRTEQDLANLKRDYDKLNENYTTLLSKRLEAQMAGRLEQRWKGDRFRILDPASLPEKPYFPKPPLIIAIGALLGLMAGLGASLVAEFIDSSVKDVQDLETMVNFPVLARISHLPRLPAA